MSGHADGRVVALFAAKHLCSALITYNSMPEIDILFNMSSHLNIWSIALALARTICQKHTTTTTTHNNNIRNSNHNAAYATKAHQALATCIGYMAILVDMAYT